MEQVFDMKEGMADAAQRAPTKKTFRQRKRDWPILVYKYWARPLAPLPDEFWQIARDMAVCWNQMVELYRAARDDAAPLKGAPKQARWALYRSALLDLRKSSDLQWECRDAVFDRFNIATKRAAKEHSDVNFHRGLSKINIPHRYTGGGLPVENIFRPARTPRRLTVKPVAPDVYENARRATTRRRITHGVFGLSKTCGFEFETILHRPIPRGAIVKTANWCGRYERSRPPADRWHWSLQLSVEVPPERYFVEHDDEKRPACAIDFGWRVIGDGELLRIGVLISDDGRCYELRLPLFMPRAADRDKRDWYSSFFDLITLDEKIGSGVQRCKDELEKLLPQLPAGFAKMRQRGLYRIRAETDGEARAVLDAWAAEDARLCSIKLTVGERLRRRKTWLYQNLAAWIAKHFCRVVIEGDLDLHQLGMQRGGPAIENAAKYRQFAGIAEFRTLLRAAAARHRTAITEVPAAYSTIQCAQCGSDSQTDRAKLWLECPNGHRWDQDINAAQNLLFSQTGMDFDQWHGLRNSMQKGKVEVIEIPAVLKAVTVRCSPP